LHKNLSVCLPPYPQGKLMFVCQYTQFASGRNKEMTHSTLSNWKKKIVPSCRLTLTVLKYIHNYLSHNNSSHEKTTSWWNFSNYVVPCIWTRACYKQNLSSAKHKSISHFKGKMPSFAGNSAGAWCRVTPCFVFFFFFECITLHQWYITFEMAMSCLAFFIKLFSSIKGGWGRRPFASFEGLFCMQS